MPFIGEKQLVVETIVASRIVPPVFAGPGAPATLTIVNPIMSGLTGGSTLGVGTGTQTVTPGGLVYSNTNGTTGFQPGATAAAKIVDLYTLPANTLAVGKSLYIAVLGSHAANTNSVTVAVNVGGTGGVGATVSGGTNIASFALIVTSGVWTIDSSTIIQAAANQQTIGVAAPGATAVLANTNVASTFDVTVAN